MGCSYGIEVELLYHTDISLNLVPGNAFSSELTMIVAIDTIEFDRNTIDQQLLTIKSYITETDLAAARLDTSSLRI